MKINFWSYLPRWINRENDPIHDGYELLEIQSAMEKSPFGEIILFSDFNIFDEQHELPHAPLLDSWTRKMNLGIRENLSELVQVKFPTVYRKNIRFFRNILTILAVQKSINGY